LKQTKNPAARQGFLYGEFAELRILLNTVSKITAMKDNFSNQAAEYASYRPAYPAALLDYICGLVPEKKLAWDCGTGNGQTAILLAAYFENVFASDISRQQLTKAPAKENIRYVLEPAEQTSLKDCSINLITVSQALHWFHFEKFYAEVKRVAAPGAIIAAWTYSLLHIEPAIDQLIRNFHDETLGSSWDDERKYVIDEYKTIPFPFKPTETPAFEIVTSWTIEMLGGYLSTWSALQKFISANGYDPLPQLMLSLKKYWLPGQAKEIIFPLYLKLGAV
jgi:SAM-dependent methyltransferase